MPNNLKYVGMDKPQIHQGSPVFEFTCDCGKKHYIKIDVLNLALQCKVGQASIARTEPKGFNARTVA